MTGKGKTSLGGKVLEQCIKAMKLRGFTSISYGEFDKDRGSMFSSDRYLVSHYPYTTIFGTRGFREYYISSPEWSGQLECKFQNGSGSVDEKMPYIAETLRRTPETHLCLVFAGKWWEEGRGLAVVEWMKREAVSMQQYGKTLVVLSLDDFFDWVEHTWRAK